MDVKVTCWSMKFIEKSHTLTNTIQLNQMEFLELHFTAKVNLDFIFEIIRETHSACNLD